MNAVIAILITAGVAVGVIFLLLNPDYAEAIRNCFILICLIGVGLCGLLIAA